MQLLYQIHFIALRQDFDHLYLFNILSVTIAIHWQRELQSWSWIKNFHFKTSYNWMIVRCLVAFNVCLELSGYTFTQQLRQNRKVLSFQKHTPLFEQSPVWTLKFIPSAFTHTSNVNKTYSRLSTRWDTIYNAECTYKYFKNGLHGEDWISELTLRKKEKLNQQNGIHAGCFSWLHLSCFE